MSFTLCLDKITELIKRKEYDKAWSEANFSLLELKKSNNDSWYMMYYQMAIICAKEKKWLDALCFMGYVIFYLETCGISHEKFILRMLKKIKKEDKMNDFIALSLVNPPKKLKNNLQILIN